MKTATQDLLIRLAVVAGGASLVLFATGAIVASGYNNVETNGLWWAQLVALIGGGSTACLWTVIRSSRLSKLSPGKESTPASGKCCTSCGCCSSCDCSSCDCCSSVSNSISTEDMKDLNALYRLSSQMADHEEGLGLCRKIHDLLFVKRNIPGNTIPEGKVIDETG